MNIQEELQQGAAEDASDSVQIPIFELAAAIWQRRRLLAIITGIGILLAVGYAFLTPSEYMSTARLMPLDQQSLSSVSMLNALAGAGNISPSMAGSLLNGRSPGATAIGILNSRVAQDDIINRFDLLRIYHCKFYVDARKILAKRSTLEENKLTGIISITVMDRDRNRARQLTEAYIEELNKLINQVSTSSAGRERLFLEERLKSLKSELDATSTELSSFSSHNATLNPQTQGQALMEAASRLQAELITAQSQLSGLKAQYSDDNIRVREARARIDELQSQLRKMSGVGEKEGDADLNANQLYPSLRQLPILGVTYFDLSRQLAIQEGIYENLTRQYELAKVQEAKEIPVIKVLDEPELPERRSFPHRAIIIVLGALVSVLAGIVWIVVCKVWEITDDSSPAKALGIALARSIRGRRVVTPN